ncbi:HNH endonuclease [Halorarum salinum]|uniref:HNH endonuclease n=1 Tax=Halorarum salinum TaxID=2743089 RepID=A0A7D5Q9W6_9EURY|nr:HNH endonuclease [Halobaculum salinum]
MIDKCFICGEDNEHVLQQHHIVPRWLDGSDRDENLVRLCANCHQAIEKIYTRQVFLRLESKFTDRVTQLVADFVDKHITHTDRETRTRTRDVYDQFVEYCRQRDSRPIDRPSFHREFRTLTTSTVTIKENSTKTRKYYTDLRIER